jgi:tRNA dimethylallyltransferase
MPHEMEDIPHHLLDICRPDELFSVVEFREYAEPIIHRLHENSQIPILCGGTGLYIDSLIFERSFPSTEPNWTLRAELEEKRQKEGNESLWNMLHEIDPHYAETLHVNNYRYVMRGIEVFIESGRSKLEAQDTQELLYDTLFLTPYHGDRESLYKVIDRRVLSMFDHGLIEENTKLLTEYGSAAP